MVGDSLGLVLVLPVNKDARRAGEMDQIAFEIDVLRSGQKPFDMLHRILPSFLFRAHQAGGWDLVQRCFCWYRPDAPAEWKADKTGLMQTTKEKVIQDELTQSSTSAESSF